MFRLAALCSALGLLVACSSSTTHTPGPDPSAAPNPIPILKKIPNCFIPAAETKGDLGTTGSYAECTISGNAAVVGTRFYIYSESRASDLAHDIATVGGKSTAEQVLIVGPHFLIVETPTLDSLTKKVVFAPVPSAVAKLVGGTVK